ncbi:hypothetical protein DMC30DRAFT_388001 [Rhodotorula diobovata]|uniref:Uncharacterized protein n=1 Tax=Rhodotorula diobovata TaxID=5288 RepID=A0A5C5G6G4_9BASI|nr:hypothetical protein DMC30DRAFT_388001 [Rhodotorula diobovata]
MSLRFSSFVARSCLVSSVTCLLRRCTTKSFLSDPPVVDGGGERASASRASVTPWPTTHGRGRGGQSWTASTILVRTQSRTHPAPRACGARRPP